MSELVPVSWSRARRYTKHRVFIMKQSTGEFLEVGEIVKKGPNLRVTLIDGRSFLVDRSRLFYTRKGK